MNDKITNIENTIRENCLMTQQASESLKSNWIINLLNAVISIWKGECLNWPQL